MALTQAQASQIRRANGEKEAHEAIDLAAFRQSGSRRPPTTAIDDPVFAASYRDVFNQVWRHAKPARSQRANQAKRNQATGK